MPIIATSTVLTRDTTMAAAQRQQKLVIAIAVTIPMIALIIVGLAFYSWRKWALRSHRPEIYDGPGDRVTELATRFQDVEMGDGVRKSEFDVRERPDDRGVELATSFQDIEMGIDARKNESEQSVSRVELTGDDPTSAIRALCGMSPPPLKPGLAAELPGEDSTLPIGGEHDLWAISSPPPVAYAESTNEYRGVEHLDPQPTLREQRLKSLRRLRIPSDDPSETFSTPAQVASAKSLSRAYVDPWQLEYRPNPVFFRHLRSPQESTETVPPTSPPSLGAVSTPRLERSLTPSPDRGIEVIVPSVHPTADNVPTQGLTSSFSSMSPAVVDQPTGFYELDATYSAFNPEVHSPMLMAGGVPYRTEQTVGVNRMFFDADREVLPFGLKRKCFQEDHSAISPRQRPQHACRMASTASWQGYDGVGSTTETSISADQYPCFSDPFQTGESRFRAMIPNFRFDERSNGDHSFFTERQAMPDRADPVELRSGHRLAQSRHLMNDLQRRSFFNAVVALHAQQDELQARFGVTSPTLRGKFELDGSSSVARTFVQSPSSLRSSLSSVVPETPRTSAASSSFFATKTNQSNSDFSTVSSATTVSVDYVGYDCPDCGAAFQTLAKMRQHHNRKHNLRHTCLLCDRPFALRADLERHKASKHANDLEHKPKVFLCPNIDCARPGKEFIRKDNFKRHAKRCGKAKGAAKGKSKPQQGADMSPGQESCCSWRT